MWVELGVTGRKGVRLDSSDAYVAIYLPEYARVCSDPAKERWAALLAELQQAQAAADRRLQNAASIAAVLGGIAAGLAAPQPLSPRTSRRLIARPRTSPARSTPMFVARSRGRMAEN